MTDAHSQTVSLSLSLLLLSLSVCVWGQLLNTAAQRNDVNVNNTFGIHVFFLSG